MGYKEVDQHKVGIIISSFFVKLYFPNLLTVNDKARRLADDPEFTNKAYRLNL